MQGYLEEALYAKNDSYCKFHSLRATCTVI